MSYCYGALVAMNFIGMRAIADSVVTIPTAWERLMRYWAGLTFSIYLLHYPLLHFFAALYGQDRSDPLKQLSILVSTLATIVVIGGFTERKKHLLRWGLNRMILALPRSRVPNAR